MCCTSTWQSGRTACSELSRPHVVSFIIHTIWILVFRLSFVRFSLFHVSDSSSNFKYENSSSGWQRIARIFFFGFQIGHGWLVVTSIMFTFGPFDGKFSKRMFRCYFFGVASHIFLFLPALVLIGQSVDARFSCSSGSPCKFSLRSNHSNFCYENIYIFFPFGWQRILFNLWIKMLMKCFPGLQQKNKYNK